MSKSFALSKEQHAAASAFGGEIAVSAAAGSGKTTVLVERYLEAIAKGATPERILAVTFTDKAANVMKERLRRRCAERGLEDVRRRLDGAWIGTIHSFCSRFLKENPVECGVDPAFIKLGEGEADRLMEGTLDRLFEEESANENVISLMADIGEESMRSGIKAFYGLCRADEGVFLEAGSPDRSIEAAEAVLKEECRRVMDGLPKKMSGAQEKLARGAAQTLEALKSGTDGWERIEAVASAIETLDRRSKNTKESVDALKERAAAWTGAYLERLALPAKREWKRLIERFAAMYDAEKRRMSALDLEGLLVAAFRALDADTPSAKALRQRVQQQFQYIFVDEYQDTSRLQAGILERSRSGDLFMVGDARQSIYRFRHAHPEIFAAALERSKRFSLSENYRSRPELLDLVNALFAPVFKDHEALKPKRAFGPGKAGCLERIVVPRDKRTLDALRVIEARTIAARIREMVEGGFRFEKGAARWRDFAILFRRSTASRIYEKELEAFGVPYFVNKGRGFYEKIEVADLINFLRILEHPSENIAMASVLRSPLVQLSDDGLFWLSRKRLASGGDASLYTAMGESAKIPELSAADRQRLEDFASLYGALRGQKDRLRLSELLHRMIDATAYPAKLMTKPEGRQTCANVWKLVEMTAAVEDRSVRGISDLIRYLQSLSESAENEAEARVIAEDENVVRILTVHAAKGLEFPCVVLADLGGEEGKVYRPAFIASSQGLGARLRKPDGQWEEDAVYRRILEEEKKNESEEDDRLLYVATTRAEEHLVLAGVESRSKEADCWLSRLSKVMEGRAVRELPPVLKRPVLPRPELLADRIPAKADKKQAEALAARLMPQDKHYRALEDLTVTRLVAEAAADPEPEFIPMQVEDEDEGQNEATPRNEFGTVFHLLMELSARQSPRGSLAESVFDDVTKVLTAEERDEAKEGLRLFWKSAVGQEVRRAGVCYPELPFIYKTGHGLLKGQMDLVFQDSDGGWAILDHKTSRLKGADARQEAVERYSWQLGLYALAFWKLSGQMPERTLLYFSALGETVELSWDEGRLQKLADELEELYLRSLRAPSLAF